VTKIRFPHYQLTFTTKIMVLFIWNKQNYKVSLHQKILTGVSVSASGIHFVWWNAIQHSLELEHFRQSSRNYLQLGHSPLLLKVNTGHSATSQCHSLWK
jgi:hypothetical protein